MNRRQFLRSASATAVAAGTGMAMPAVWSPARAQGRQETLLIVSESGPNNLDIHGVGTNVPGYEASWNCYDRLISHEMKTGPNGVPYYDRDAFKPELAEDMNVGDMSVTFRLRKDAAFQDGTPVTAKDVKWSLDRAVSVGGFPTFQMKAGSLEKPEQFVVVDDRTVRVDFLAQGPAHGAGPRRHRAVRHQLRAREEERRPQRPVGARIHEAEHGRRRRLPGRRSGRPAPRSSSSATRPGRAARCPSVPGASLAHGAVGRQPARAPRARRRRHLLRSAEQGLRRAQVEREAVDRVDAVLERHPVHRHEREEAALRQPEGAPGRRLRDALPEDHGRGAVRARQADVRRAARAAAEVAWPQPHGYDTDLAKARQLLAEAGYPNGFETTLSFDLGFAVVNEPLCVLVQESLGQIGIKTTINKIPGATWRTELNKKEMPLFTNVFSGWLDYPEYFFFWCYHGKTRSSTR